MEELKRDKRDKKSIYFKKDTHIYVSNQLQGILPISKRIEKLKIFANEDRTEIMVQRIPPGEPGGFKFTRYRSGWVAYCKTLTNDLLKGEPFVYFEPVATKTGGKGVKFSRSHE